MLFKLLFPKLYFGLDEPTGGGGAPSGQPDPTPSGNDPVLNPESPAPSPTEDLEFGSVKIPKSAFEQKAKELYKEEFEARENRDKWQAENTRRAQELKQLERDAEAFRRLQSENRPQPKNKYEAERQAYVDEAKANFPDVDPKFFEWQFQKSWELSGKRSQESLDPILERQANDWEEKFLASHPLLKPATEHYEKMKEMLSKGYDPEDAYGIVFRKELMEKEFETRRKAEDAERLRKLKGTPSNTQTGEKPMTGSRSERIWAAMEKAGVSRD